MAAKKNDRAAGPLGARHETSRSESVTSQNITRITRKDTEPMAAYASHGQAQYAAAKEAEGVTVTGEAVRHVSPEHAEFLIEVVASAPTAAQALRDNQLKSTQVAQSLQALECMRRIYRRFHRMSSTCIRPPSCRRCRHGECRRSGRLATPLLGALPVRHPIFSSARAIPAA